MTPLRLKTGIIVLSITKTSLAGKQGFNTFCPWARLRPRFQAIIPKLCWSVLTSYRAESGGVMQSFAGGYSSNKDNKDNTAYSKATYGILMQLQKTSTLQVAEGLQIPRFLLHAMMIL